MVAGLKPGVLNQNMGSVPNPNPNPDPDLAIEVFVGSPEVGMRPQA